MGRLERGVGRYGDQDIKRVSAPSRLCIYEKYSHPLSDSRPDTSIRSPRSSSRLALSAISPSAQFIRSVPAIRMASLSKKLKKLLNGTDDKEIKEKDVKKEKKVKDKVVSL